MSATGSVLVDTSIVVDYLRQDLALHQRIDRIEDVFLPLVVLGELLYGSLQIKAKGKGASAGAGILPWLHCHPA